MIQRPASGQVRVEVPGVGPLVSAALLPTLQRLFDGALVSGTAVDADGQRAIDWAIEGTTKVTLDDPRVAEAVTRILESADRVEATAGEITARLERHADPGSPLRIPRELALRMGAVNASDFIPYPDAELRPLRDAMLRSAKAIRRAVANGDLVMRDGRVLVYGWGFLPRQDLAIEPLPPPSGAVSLELLPDEVQPDRIVQRLKWRTTGSASRVELLRVDGPEAVVAETSTPITGVEGDGVWRFPLGQLVAGSRYQARAHGPWGSVYSSKVAIPGAPALPEPPRDLPVVPPPIETPPEPPITTPPTGPKIPVVPVPPKEPETGPEPPRRGIPRWIWVLLGLLLLALLLFLLWLLLPMTSGRIDWSMPRTAEHLPRAVQDVDPPPVAVPMHEAPHLVLPDGLPPETVVVTSDEEEKLTVVQVPAGTSWREGYYVVLPGGEAPIWVAPPTQPFHAARDVDWWWSGEHSGEHWGRVATGRYEVVGDSETSRMSGRPKRRIPKVVPTQDAGSTTGSELRTEGTTEVRPEVVDVFVEEDPTPTTRTDTTEESRSESPESPESPKRSDRTLDRPEIIDPRLVPPGEDREPGSDAPTLVVTEQPRGSDELPTPDLTEPENPAPPSEAVVPRPGLELAWDGDGVALLASGSPCAAAGWKGVIGVVLAGPLEAEVPRDSDEAARWASALGCRIVDCVAIAGETKVRLLVIDSAARRSGSAEPAGRRLVALPALAEELVLGIVRPANEATDATAAVIDARVRASKGRIVDLPEATLDLEGTIFDCEGLRSPDGSTLEVVRLRLRPEIGQQEVVSGFNDGRCQLAPLVVRQSLRAPAGSRGVP